MQPATVLIYSPGGGSSRLSVGGRLLALGIAAGCLAVLLTAMELPPSARGFGTHTRLGLSSCQFFDRTGIPCPACGMTTSFAWFVRGRVLRSFYVQPMGAALAALTCCCVWAGFYIALTARPVYRLLWLLPARYYYLPLMSWAVIGWGWKIFIYLHGID